MQNPNSSSFAAPCVPCHACLGALEKQWRAAPPGERRVIASYCAAVRGGLLVAGVVDVDRSITWQQISPIAQAEAEAVVRSLRLGLRVSGFLHAAPAPSPPRGVH